MTKPNHRDTRGAGRGAWPVRLLGAVGIAATVASSLGAAGALAEPARLTSISALTEGRALTIVLETSEPVPYVTAQPDPLTLVIDLRNTRAAGVASSVNGPVGPVVDVAAADARADDGAPIARVRLTLAQPVKPVVRSRRAAILVEFGAAGAPAPPVPAVSREDQPAPARVVAAKAPAAAPAKAVPAKGGAEPALTTIDVGHSTEGTRVIVAGSAALPAEPASSVTLIDPTRTDPPRIVLDFRGVAAPSRTVPGPADGHVARVRVAQYSRQPLVARVVIDLRREAPYRVERSDGQLAVVVGAAAPGTVQAAAAGHAEGQPTPPAAVAPPAAASAAPGPSPVIVAPEPGAPVAAPPPSAVSTPADAVPAEPVKAAPVPLAAPTQTSVPAQAPPKPAAAAKKPAADTAKPASAPPTPVATPAMAPAQEPPAAAPVAPPAAVPPASPQAETPPPAGSVQKAYTGSPVTFDFQGADLRAVLRTFSEISGLNVVIDPSITGTVDVSLKEVPWDQALEIILRANKLGYSIENNVVRIATLKALAEEEQERQKLAEAQAKGGQLRVLTRSLSYAKAVDLAKLLKDARIITDRGTAFVDERSNTLIINDLPEAVAGAEELIGTLDRAEPQVEIEARIVQTTRENARALGVQWGVNGRMASELGNTSNLRFPAQGSISGRTGVVQGSPTGALRSETPTGVNLPVSSPTSAVGIAMGTLNGSFNLDVALSALEKKGHGRILSTPRVVMQNNVEAEMYQGIQIPIQTVSNNTVTVTFKDAALSLRVRPQITASDTVIMDINLENASPDYSREVNGIPPIDTQRARTQVLVNDGDTTVIGGIYVQRETTSQDRVPILHRIPLLGWLFKRDAASDDNRELLIFITPKIRR